MLVMSSRSQSSDMRRSYSGGGVTSMAPLPAEALTVLPSSWPLSIERRTWTPGGLAQWCLAPHAWSGYDVAGDHRSTLRRARRPMQVQCSKCFQLIALSDIIESNNGRVSHMNCARPRTLTIDERTLLFAYCAGHVVVQCLPCGLSFRIAELAADPLGGDRAYRCP